MKYYLMGVITMLCVAFSCISMVVMYNQEQDNIAQREEIAIRDSYIEDLCTAIDKDEDNVRTECKDIMDANDYGAGLTTKGGTR